MVDWNVAELSRGVLAGDRSQLARAITLVESRREEDQGLARQLLSRVAEGGGSARRVGITGPPGVGKSSLIEKLGGYLVEAGHRVAVLAVDPSSARRGGSILGDKARMTELAQNEGAFIRPSPSDATLGGVARRTRESMLLCEAAGYDVVLVETVGVGQSETVVAQMVDSFVVLLLPGAGDELQGIKKGILELADVVAINKADGEGLVAAREAQRAVSSALRVSRASDSWQPPVVAVSAREATGLQELWKAVEDHVDSLGQGNRLEQRRRQQRLDWMWDLINEGLMQRFRAQPGARDLLGELEGEVAAGRVTPGEAAGRLMDRLRDD